MIGQCCNCHGINSTIEISWELFFRILADYRLRLLVNNVAMHIYIHDYVNSICHNQISNWWRETFKCNTFISKVTKRNIIFVHFLFFSFLCRCCFFFFLFYFIIFIYVLLLVFCCIYLLCNILTCRFQQNSILYSLTGTIWQL